MSETGHTNRGPQPDAKKEPSESEIQATVGRYMADRLERKLKGEQLAGRREEERHQAKIVELQEKNQTLQKELDRQVFLRQRMSKQELKLTQERDDALYRAGELEKRLERASIDSCITMVKEFAQQVQDRLVRDAIERTLNKQGLALVFPSIDDRFIPDLHEAVHLVPKRDGLLVDSVVSGGVKKSGPSGEIYKKAQVRVRLT